MPATLFKKRRWHMCFPVNFAKFLRTPFNKASPGDFLFILSTKFNFLILKAKLFILVRE